MPAHCGIPGNEWADALTKQGAQTPELCRHARVTRSWLQAKARNQMMTELTDRTPAEPLPNRPFRNAPESPGAI